MTRSARAGDCNAVIPCETNADLTTAGVHRAYATTDGEDTLPLQYTPNGGSAATRAEYTYNALNWRIMKRADTNPSVGTALDQERKMFFSANWQMVEERIDDDYLNNAGVNRRFQYIWGPRYIDDIAIRRLDGNADGDFGDAGTDFTYYHCNDAQFSTVAVLNDTAVLQERVSYDPYGRARHHKPADCADGEGGASVNDQLQVNNTRGSVTVAGDVTRDGKVTVNDLMLVLNTWGAGLAFGQLSSTDNVIGWDGYVFNPELDEDGLDTVRYRHYRPAIGRWIERDALGYVDGRNNLQVSRGNPPANIDSFGQYCVGPSLPCSLPPLGEPGTTPIVWPDGWKIDPRHFPSAPTTEQHRLCCLRATWLPGKVPDAQVVCCGGKKIICIWKPAQEGYPPLPNEGSKPEHDAARATAHFWINECMIQHERRHAEGQDRTSCESRPDGVAPMPWRLDPSYERGTHWDSRLGDCEHCAIYRAELDCLLTAKGRCVDTPFPMACERMLDRAIDTTRDLMRERGCDKFGYNSEEP